MARDKELTSVEFWQGFSNLYSFPGIFFMKKLRCLSLYDLLKQCLPITYCGLHAGRPEHSYQLTWNIEGLEKNKFSQNKELVPPGSRDSLV